jgi:hypothetical protein
MERTQSNSALNACVRISRMMWESVAGTGGLLERIDGFSHDKPSTADQDSAKVLPFKMADSHTRARSDRSDDDR